MSARGRRHCERISSQDFVFRMAPNRAFIVEPVASLIDNDDWCDFRIAGVGRSPRTSTRAFAFSPSVSETIVDRPFAIVPEFPMMPSWQYSKTARRDLHPNLILMTRHA